MTPFWQLLTACCLSCGLALAAPAGAGQTALPALPAATAAERAALTRGRALVADFYALRVERLWQSFTPQMQAEWGPLAAFRAYREAGLRTYGAERRVLRERTFTQGGVTYYVRSATFGRDPGTVWAVVLGFDAVGRVARFAIVAEAKTQPGRVAAAREAGAWAG
ncbi:hypothetical protein [Deinococcus budaensis]|uniref:DUF4019 domain-containing protein n=1 Tax=Deinococcus budaensis TaxID=1665626 RepID=A0A7W8GG18_9DEIO|nr:hypothetical protein [Deinococcus budaensis]MBB5235014.1 hypothetical protein [Deinococcus budaensis]